MIHIENITINIHHPYNTETGPANDVSEALMKPMGESILKEQESEEDLEREGETQPPNNPARMNSLQQRAYTWMEVCAMLNELCPGWSNGTGSAADQAAAAIRAMAKSR